MDRILSKQLDNLFWYRKEEEIYSKVSHKIFWKNKFSFDEGTMIL